MGTIQNLLRGKKRKSVEAYEIQMAYSAGKIAGIKEGGKIAMKSFHKAFLKHKKK